MPSVTFRLPPNLHEAFISFCERRGERPSDVLRTAIDKLMDANDTLGHHGPKARDRQQPVAPDGIYSVQGQRVKGFGWDGKPIYYAAGPVALPAKRAK